MPLEIIGKYAKNLPIIRTGFNYAKVIVNE